MPEERLVHSAYSFYTLVSLLLEMWCHVVKWALEGDLLVNDTGLHRHWLPSWVHFKVVHRGGIASHRQSVNRVHVLVGQSFQPNIIMTQKIPVLQRTRNVKWTASEKRDDFTLAGLLVRADDMWTQIFVSIDSGCIYTTVILWKIAKVVRTVVSEIATQRDACILHKSGQRGQKEEKTTKKEKTRSTFCIESVFPCFIKCTKQTTSSIHQGLLRWSVDRS